MNATIPPDHFPIARFIKEVGRGKKGARSLAPEDAFQLYRAMLEGRVSDLELGGFMLAMRIKGESAAEIAGFLDAAEQAFAPLQAPAGPYAPVVLPSYNGSRQMPNLTPLLALLLARQGVPVLMHGVTADPGRVTSADILAALELPPLREVAQAQQCFAQRLPAFLPIEVLAPPLARLLALRRILGVRNSTHTVVKLLQPFAQPALRLVSYTHPEYLEMLTAYFGQLAPPARGDVFLMRGTEGETVAHARRGQQIQWFHARQGRVLAERQEPNDAAPPLPATSDAVTTAAWIRLALAGEVPIPEPIAQQAAHCLQVAAQLRTDPEQ